MLGGLIFQVRNATTAEVLVSVPGTPSSVGAADFSATIPLNGANINEGPALLLVATISYQTSKTLDSDPVPIKIDHTPPVLDTSGYDGTVSPWVGPGNPNAIVAVHVTDSGAGVDPAGVKLTLLPPGDGSSYTGAPGTGGTYTFTVPLAAMGVADTTVNPAVPFKVDANSPPSRV